MTVLTIETSTPEERVAVVRDGAVVAEAAESVGRGHTEVLLSTVDAVLSAAGVVLSDLDAIVVSIGPGRFSGLRVGLATAKGLASSSGVRVVPVETLPALAESGGPWKGPVCPMLDARRGEVYGALFQGGEGYRRRLPDAALPPADLLDVVAAEAGCERVLFVGSGATIAADEIAARFGDAAAFPKDVVAGPTPLAMAAMAERGEAGAADAGTLEPIYLRGI